MYYFFGPVLLFIFVCLVDFPLCFPWMRRLFVCPPLHKFCCCTKRTFLEVFLIFTVKIFLAPQNGRFRRWPTYRIVTTLSLSRSRYSILGLSLLAWNSWTLTETVSPAKCFEYQITLASGKESQKLKILENLFITSIIAYLSMLLFTPVLKVWQEI